MAANVLFFFASHLSGTLEHSKAHHNIDEELWTSNGKLKFI